MGYWGSNITVENCNLSNNDIGFYGLNGSNTIEGLTFSGNNIFEYNGTGVNLNRVANLSITDPVSVRNNSTAVSISNISVSSANDLSSAIFYTDGSNGTSINVNGMSNFTLQGDGTSTPTRIIDLLCTDGGKFRLDLGTNGARYVGEPVYLYGVGAVGSPVYVKDMNLSWVGLSRNGYGVYVYGAESLVLDNITASNRNYAINIGYWGSNITVENCNLSNNDIGFYGLNGSNTIEGLTFSGNNIFEYNGTGVNLNRVANLSIMDPVSVRNNSTAVSITNISVSSANDLSSAIFYTDGSNGTSINVNGMGNFTLQGDGTSTPTRIIDLLCTDGGKFRLDLGTNGARYVGEPVYLYNVGAVGSPAYVKDMNLSWVGLSRNGYGVYVYGAESLVLDNITASNRNYAINIGYWGSNITVENCNLSNNDIGFYGLNGLNTIEGLTFSGNNIFEYNGTGVNLNRVANLSITDPVSVRNNSTAVSISNISVSSANDLSSAIFYTDGSNGTSINVNGMGNFTLQGDGTSTPTRIIDLLCTDGGKFRLDLGTNGARYVGEPVYLYNVGAVGSPAYVKDMNLSWVGLSRNGYGVYVYGAESLVLDNITASNRNYAINIGYWGSNITVENCNLSNNDSGFYGLNGGYTINGFEFTGNGITNNGTGITLINIDNSDGSLFDASTIYHNNVYNNGLNIYASGSNTLVLGGNYWGHTTTPCFYTVESGLTPADANRTGIDDPSCVLSASGW